MLLLSLSASLWVLATVPSASGFVPAISNLISSRINATKSIRQSCPYLSPPGVLLALGTHSGTGNPIYPPGYDPGHSSYWYQVPGTTVSLKCGSFQSSPRQNSVQIDNVLNKVLARYGNPQRKDNSVFNGNLNINFEDGSPGHGKMVFGIHLGYWPFADPLALKYGEVIKGVRGVDYIRRHFPLLDMCCSIMVQEGQNELIDHGLITLHTEDSFEAQDASN